MTEENMPVVGSNEDIAPVDISEEMRRSYLDYAMSVIVSRALPEGALHIAAAASAAAAFACMAFLKRADGRRL